MSSTVAAVTRSTARCGFEQLRNEGLDTLAGDRVGLVAGLDMRRFDQLIEQGRRLRLAGVRRGRD